MKVNRYLGAVFLFNSFVILVSCAENLSKHNLEIYLLKERIAIKDGFSLDEANKFVQPDSLELEATYKNARYDTINKEFINAGKFEVNLSQLQDQPLITDNEILNVSSDKNEITLSATGANKIFLLKPDMRHGIQFVLCNNKKPILTGYFWSTYSSYGSHWNCLEYDHTKKADQKEIFKMYRSNGIDARRREKIILNDSLKRLFLEESKLKE